jgi:hypothetical protein
LGTLALAFVILVWSIATIVVDGFAQHYRAIATHLENNGVRDLTYYARVERALNANGALLACPRELVRNAVSIKLAGLDASYRSGKTNAWEPMSSATDALLRDAVHCFPHDGKLWLRLAMVEFSRNGPTNKVQQMLTLSAKTAPSDVEVLSRRITFASKLQDFGLPAVQDVVQKDIRTLVRYAHPDEVGTLYLKVSDRSREIFEENFALLKAERRSALDIAINSLTVGPAERRH